MIQDSLFCAKILLFGEYGIINDSMGLSIPYNNFKGKLIKNSPDWATDFSSRQSLNEFYSFLKEESKKGSLSFKIDLKKFKTDLDRGMYFESSIPQGFGVGSSGALCAAIYNEYAKERIVVESAEAKEPVGKKQVMKLKEIFAQMESYFHGKSSGLDPLICYLNLPILINSSNDLGTVGMPKEGENGAGAIFLLDSGMPGETQPMVNIFMEKLKSEGFRKMLKEQFNTYNDASINAFLKRDIKSLFGNLKKLSKVLLENFRPMIPQGFHDLWKKGIDTNTYYLKLCGSGGGGFILGFTKDIDETKTLLKDHNLEIIYNF